MEQYEKSGPTIKSEPRDTKDPDVRHLEERLAEQERLIKDLQREVRQLKSRLDQHADRFNRQARG